MGAAVDLTGRVFGRLTVREFYGMVQQGKQKRAFWACDCICGKQTIVMESNLKYGNTKSCGCFQRDRLAEVLPRHGHATNGVISTEYTSWYNMIQRCQNPKNPVYANYGGRGIQVCKDWQVFTGFIQSMGLKPSHELSIERKDNNLGYFPENCVWADQTVQSRNQRQRRDNTSGVTGVRFTKSNMWEAYISRNRKIIYLGTFATIAEAAAARSEAKRQLGYNPNHGTARRSISSSSKVQSATDVRKK